MIDINEISGVTRLDTAKWREVPHCQVCDRWDFPKQAWMHTACIGHKAYTGVLPAWLSRDQDALEHVLASKVASVTQSSVTDMPSVTESVTNGDVSVTQRTKRNAESVTQQDERNALSNADRQRAYRLRQKQKSHES